MNDPIQQILHAWETGGPVLIPLALVAFVSYATAASLMLKLYYRGVTKASDSDLKKWIAQPEQAPRRVRELIRYTQDEAGSIVDIEGRFREVEAAQIHDVDRRLAFLAIIVISAPLFGLLGTVSGMLLTFKAIGIGGSSASDVIAKGISEALIATQAGMMVAVPGLIMVTVAKRLRNEYVTFLSRLQSVTLRHFRPHFHGMTRLFTREDFKSGRSAGGAPNTISA
jgi:biopolymer transport protein ExbB